MCSESSAEKNIVLRSAAFFVRAGADDHARERLGISIPFVAAERVVVTGY
jgi:hypothetical protein